MNYFKANFHKAGEYSFDGLSEAMGAYDLQFRRVEMVFFEL